MGLLSCQLHAEVAHIDALLAQLGDFFQCSDGVPCRDGLADLKQVAPVRDTGHTADERLVHVIVDTGAGVQNGQRVTHGTVGQTANQLCGVLVQLDLLLPSHVEQPPGNVIRRDAGEACPADGRKRVRLQGGDLLRRAERGQLRQRLVGEAGQVADRLELALAAVRAAGCQTK